MEIKIRDLRRKSKFVIDDEYLNGYAKLCGVYSTAVYTSLCRHADKNQECFPSIKLIAEEHNIGERTVIRAIKKLGEYKIIRREKTRRENGKWLNNLYILNDKSEWKLKPSATQAGGSQVPENTEPSAREYISQVPHRHTKETHREGNTYKETHLSEQSSHKDISSIKSKFKKVPPPFNSYEYIKKMTAEKNIRHIRIIGRFFLLKEKHKYIKNKEQMNQIIKRNLRVATQIATYENGIINKSFETAQAMGKEKKFRWTLETVLKLIET